MLRYEYICMLDSTPLLLAYVSHSFRMITETWSKQIQDTVAYNEGDNVRLKFVFGECTREWLRLKRLAERLGSATSVLWAPLLAWITITLSILVYVQFFEGRVMASYLVTPLAAICMALVICMVGQSVSDQVKTIY